ncbi:MAG: hypothetical protein QOJ02_4062 [Acidobacteriota bacterium]|nr:hypothetical protein [Acidobacteriota bacterium]
MNKTRCLFMLLLVCFVFAACGSKDGSVGSNGTTDKAADSSLGDPKGSIAYQFDLLKAGDVDKLKNCFTERQRERITKERIDKAREKIGQITLDDLVASTEMGEYEGKKTAKIKMKNGRTLTTLILTDGKWLSDTIWFD